MDRGIEEFDLLADCVFSEVAERGWDDREEQVDDFLVLRRERRFRDALCASLYEEYFLPRRHEFEWRVLEDMIRTVISSPSAQFFGAAVASGVVGNAAWELIKVLARKARSRMDAHLGARGEVRAHAFDEIEREVTLIAEFFKKTPEARVDQIAAETGIRRERAHALMKIAGLSHRRRGEACFWFIPEPQEPVIADELRSRLSASASALEESVERSKTRER